MPRFLLIAGVLGCLCLSAAQHSGTVRAADQLIPGATVIARQGGAKLTTYTDEQGRYQLDLTPGKWELEIDMMGFRRMRGEIDGAEPTLKDWTLEMPRFGEAVETVIALAATKSSTPAVEKTAPAPVPTTEKTPTAPAQTQGPRRQPGANGQQAQNRQSRLRGQGTGGRGQNAANGPGGRGGPNGQRGFTNLNVTATEAGAQEVAAAANSEQMADVAAVDDDFTISGSNSGGLQQAADDQMRANRQAGRGGPGGPGGPGGGASLLMNASLADLGFSIPGGADGLGMGGFGAAGAAAGFGADTGGGFGPPGGRGGAGGGSGGGGGRGGAGGGGGGGGRGGGGGGRGQQAGGRGGRGGRGPFNGQFAAFGNRRRQQPAYTGNMSVNVTNSALNAAPFSLNGQNIVKPYSARENATFTVGGPLRIPKLVSNDKWFFNLSLSGNLARNGRSTVSTVPTLAERSGDFSAAVVANKPVTIYDPLSGSPFPGNLIPSNRFNSASLGLLQYFPLPMYSGIIQNYSIAPSTPSSGHTVGIRLNGPVTAKDTINLNFQYSGNDSTSQQLFGFQDTSNGAGLSATAGYRHVFKPRLNNNASLTFSRNNSKMLPYFAYKDNVAYNLGITGTDQTPVNWGPPNLSFSNFGGLTDGAASDNRSQTTNFTDTLTWVYKRKHNISVGFGYRRMQNNSLSYANSRGAFSFGGIVTSGFNADGTTLPNTGFDFADFLLGLPQTSSRRIGASNNYFRGQAWNWYVQDDFRVSSRLTLNLGLRWEYFTPYTELQGHLANLDPNPSMTAVSVVTPVNPIGPYSGQFPVGLVYPDKNNYSPRIGFAWRPSQKNGRLIRGGYSIFFSGSAYNQIASRMAAQPPFANSASLSTSLANPLTMQNGFPLVPDQIANTFAIDKNFRLAYAQTWSLALQQPLPHNLLAELEYIGTKGTGLDLSFVPNELPPNSLASKTSTAPPATYTYLTDQANSIFHAGQVRVTRRFARGMSAMALYTLSKSIDNASTFSGGTGGTVIQDPTNFSADRGLSSFSQTHNLSVTFTLSSPVGIHGWWRNGGWKTKAFTGWTLNGTYNAHSGTPLTALISGALAKKAVSGQLRAEATGLPADNAAGYFNLAAFTLPPNGEFGNAGRNTITGPALFSFNAAMNRAFRFGETRRQLQVRISANNVMNHIQITSFGTTVNSNNYGLATAASATRNIQMLLRLNF